VINGTRASIIEANALRLLPNAHRNGNREISFNCPAHDDDRASGSFSVGDEGRPLLTCHVGCSNNDIAHALEFTGEGDLYSKLDGRSNGTKRRTPKTIHKITVRRAERKHAKKTERIPESELLKHPVAAFIYRDKRGRRLYKTVRYELKGQKTFRVFTYENGAWVPRLLKNVPRVLYRLDKQQGRTSTNLFEGEGVVRAAVTTFGLSATTTLGGAGGWQQEYAQQLTDAGITRLNIFPDNDAAGRTYAENAARDCDAAGIEVRLIELPGLPEKGDLVDWIAAGGTKADLLALTKRAPRYPYTCTLVVAERTFAQWLGDDYDMAALHAACAAAATSRLPGESVWLLLVSGSGNAKTETVQSLVGANALVTSTITSEGALLSGTPTRDNAPDSTGGLLRRLGSNAVLVIKDMTSIISMAREVRAGVLAALREIHDGKWERNLGTDGGKTLTWTGRITIVGAVTTAWDAAHSVIATMGDRFVLLRMDSREGRESAGSHAIRNTGREQEMRAELATVVGGVVAGMSTREVSLTKDETTRLLAAANITTLCRTAVECDYRGDPIEAHQPEMPTRFAKQLTQMIRGAIAIGMPRAAAMRLAIRCARDSMPAMRLAVLEDVTAHPSSTLADVHKRLDQPRNTVKRQLESLHLLRVLTCTERMENKKKLFCYRVAKDIDPQVLSPAPRVMVRKSK
jgi:hypothetical protein